LTFWTREAGPKATLVVLVVVVVVISSLKVPKAFLIRSGAQRNFAYIRADIIVTFPQIYHLGFSTYYLMVSILRSACSAACIAAACCSTMRGAALAVARGAVEHSNEYLCTGGAYRRYIVK